MTKESEFIIKIIDEYGLSAPLTKDEKKFIKKTSKQVYKRVFKTVGVGSFAVGLYFTLFYFLKKLGMSYLIFKIIIGGLVIGSVSVGGYIAVKQVIEKQKENTKIEKKIEKEEVKKEQKKIIYKVGFKPFHSLDESIPPTFINQISNKIINECNKRKGTNFAGMISDEKNYRYVTRGEVIKYDNKIRIFIRTGETKTTLSKFYVKEEGDIDKLDEICQKVAEEFIKKYEVINK